MGFLTFQARPFLKLHEPTVIRSSSIFCSHGFLANRLLNGNAAMYRILFAFQLLWAFVLPYQGWQSAIGEETSQTSTLDIPDAEIQLYKTVNGKDLSLYVFKPPGHVTTDRRPAVVFFFGGGWIGGTPQQFVPHCRYLASRGMLAATADYRVRSRQGTTPFECVADGKSAVRWLRHHAARLGVDPDRIAAGGGSAGGHVAAATGIVPGLDDPHDPTEISAQPNALLLFNPVYDNGPDGYGYDRVKERYLEISPLHNIGPGAPPTIVFLGTRDDLIPMRTAQQFEDSMKAVGCRCETRFYVGQKHGFFNKGRADDKYFIATILETDKFLKSMGWLQGPPTVDEFMRDVNP